MTRHYKALSIAALTILIASTATSGSRSSLFLGTPAPRTYGGTPFPATLADIQLNVFDPSCSFCHYEGSDLGGGLWLDTADHAFEKLVNYSSPLCDGETRVIPFNADASYLIKKLEGMQPCGDQMPLGDQPLDPAVIGVIRQWINDGALREPPIAAMTTTWGAVKAGLSGNASGK